MHRVLVLVLLACALLPAAARAEHGSGSGQGEPEARGGAAEPENRGRGHALSPDDRALGERGEDAAPPAGGIAGRPLDARTRARATSSQVLASLPAHWCGTARALDDTRDERANGAWRFHAIYALAADSPDRFAALATGIQTDAFQASALLETLYGRAIRFDMGTDCGPQFLDITVVRLPQTAAQLAALAAQPTGTLDAVAAALDAKGMTTAKTTDTLDALRLNTRNYVVWLDAPAPPDACGQATMEPDTDRNPDTNRSNFGGKVAVVFRAGDGFCNSTAARHEIAHTLGAVRALAPHAVDGAHCSDAYDDTMCVGSAPRVGPAPAGGFFDYGNDDYWSPPGRPLGWWTVDQSRFLCPDVSCNVPSPHEARPRLRARATRLGRGWTLDGRVTGAGRVRVTVSCRTRRGAPIRRVRSRALAAPAQVRMRVHCFSQPRAALRRS